MPIRFRCVYCNQLLGISRRKAGTIVRCTTCQGQLIVPDPDEGTTEPAPEQPAQPRVARDDQTSQKADLFEHGDFDELLGPFSPGASPAAVASPPKPASARRKSDTASPAPVVATSAGTQPAGLVLNGVQITVVCVLLVLGLGIAFTGGLLLGLSLNGG